MLKRILGSFVAGAILLASLPAQAVELNYGYDVSYPQGNRINTLPAPGPFSVVGVNGGRAFDPNSSLLNLLTWAGTNTDLYVNTGNPGPTLSTRYVAGTEGGRTCDVANLNSGDCAFVYGYRAAADSYRQAADAFLALGWTNLPNRTWWLDVETVNSWRGITAPNGAYEVGLTPQQIATHQALNVENLKGAVHYFKNVAQVQSFGIYSTNYQWGRITGGNISDFSDLLSWHAVGYDGEEAAKSLCQSQPGFTGGQKVRVQYIDSSLDLDVNVPCTLVKASVKPAYVGVKAVKVKKAMTLKVALKTVQGVPIAKRSVTVTFAGKKHQLTTGPTGLASKRITAPKYRGNYKVKLSFVGADILNPASASTTIRLYR